MQPVQFDRSVTIWRKVAQPDGSYQDTQVFQAIPCAIVPISTFGDVVPYARESTHVGFMPHWLQLRREDQIRAGQSVPDEQGDLLQDTYTIVSRPEWRLGIPQVHYYLREMN